MSDPRWLETIRAIEARKWNRRRLVQSAAAVTAAAAVVPRPLFFTAS